MSEPESNPPSDSTGAPGQSAPHVAPERSSAPSKTPLAETPADDTSTVGTGTALALISIAIVLIVIVIGGVIALLG